MYHIYIILSVCMYICDDNDNDNDIYVYMYMYIYIYTHVILIKHIIAYCL